MCLKIGPLSLKVLPANRSSKCGEECYAEMLAWQDVREMLDDNGTDIDHLIVEQKCGSGIDKVLDMVWEWQDVTVLVGVKQ